MSYLLKFNFKFVILLESADFSCISVYFLQYCMDNNVHVYVFQCILITIDNNVYTFQSVSVMYRKQCRCLLIYSQCCIDDNVSVAEMLLSHGASVNAVDDDLWTPLHYACELDNSEIVQLLLTVSITHC